MSDEERAALPKGERMFLAKRDESTGKGEEILQLAHFADIPASTAADLIMLNGYEGALALLERTRGVLARIEGGGDTRQAPPVIADTASSTRVHRGDAKRAPGMTDLMVTPESIDAALDAEGAHRGWNGAEETLPATVPIENDRCTSTTRVALHSEGDEQPEWEDVQCYLNESFSVGGHAHEWHQGWHPRFGSLTWFVESGAEKA